MIRLFGVLLLMLFSVGTFSQEKRHLFVYLKDGTELCFQIDASLRTSFSTDNIKITSPVVSTEIPRSNVQRIAFLPIVESSVTDLSLDGDFKIEGNRLVVSSLTAGTLVQVYTISGTSVTSDAAGSDGLVSLPLDILSPGVYILNYNAISIKFLKK